MSDRIKRYNVVVKQDGKTIERIKGFNSKYSAKQYCHRKYPLSDIWHDSMNNFEDNGEYFQIRIITVT